MKERQKYICMYISVILDVLTYKSSHTGVK